MCIRLCKWESLNQSSIAIVPNRAQQCETPLIDARPMCYEENLLLNKYLPFWKVIIMEILMVRLSHSVYMQISRGKQRQLAEGTRRCSSSILPPPFFHSSDMSCHASRDARLSHFSCVQVSSYEQRLISGGIHDDHPLYLSLPFPSSYTYLPENLVILEILPAMFIPHLCKH